MRPLAITGVALVAPPRPGAPDLSVAGDPDGISGEGEALREVLPRYVPRRMLRRMTHFGSMVVGGALRSLDRSGIRGSDIEPRVASVLGTAYGEITMACKIFQGGMDARVSPTSFHNSVHNGPLGYLGMFSGIRGPSLAVSDSTLSAETAFEEAWALVAEGAAPAVIVASGDESCPSMFSPCWREGEDAPRQTARSVEGTDGYATDEACAVCVVEDLDAARQRGADVLATAESLSHGPDLGDVLGNLARESRPDVVLLPAALDRGLDESVAGTVREVLGSDVDVRSEGSRVGYVPASGGVRIALAVEAARARGCRVLAVGVDLDGHAVALVVSAGGAC